MARIRTQEKTTKSNKLKQAHPSALTITRNAPDEARRIIFRRKHAQTAPCVDKEDIILAVDRGLARGHFPGFVRAIDVGYSSTGAVTILLAKGLKGLCWCLSIGPGGCRSTTGRPSNHFC